VWPAGEAHQHHVLSVWREAAAKEATRSALCAPESDYRLIVTRLARIGKDKELQMK
jgi:hypothetical protein